MYLYMFEFSISFRHVGFEITSFTLKRDPGAGFSLCEGRVCVADVCVRPEDNSVLFLMYLELLVCF